MTGTVIGLWYVFVPCVGREGFETCPLPWSGVGSLVWSAGRWQLGKKSHLVTYTELVPWWLQVGSAVEGIRVEVSKIKSVEEKVNTVSSSLQNPYS